MSITVINIVDGRRFGSMLRKAVMIHFAKRADASGRGIWAAKTTIAEDVECSRASVIRAINGLVAEGLLKVVGTRRCVSGVTVEYDIDLDAVERLPERPDRLGSLESPAPRAAPEARSVADPEGESRIRVIRPPYQGATQTVLEELLKKKKGPRRFRSRPGRPRRRICAGVCSQPAGRGSRACAVSEAGRTWRRWSGGAPISASATRRSSRWPRR